MIDELSREAYRRQMPYMAERAAALVSYLIDHDAEGVTVDEYWPGRFQSKDQIAPTFTHLEQDGVIVKGETRATRLGRPAHVYRLRPVAGTAPHGGTQTWPGCARALSGLHIGTGPRGTCRNCGAARPS